MFEAPTPRAPNRAVPLASKPFSIRRLTTALTALALAWALLVAAPPGRAAFGGAGDRASDRIEPGRAACLGAVPSAPERIRAAPQGLADSLAGVDAAKPAEPPAARTAALAGGTPPALSRWRLAHATSTSIP